jgi:hypothetical protein
LVNSLQFLYNFFSPLFLNFWCSWLFVFMSSGHIEGPSRNVVCLWYLWMLFYLFLSIWSHVHPIALHLVVILLHGTNPLSFWTLHHKFPLPILMSWSMYFCIVLGFLVVRIIYFRKKLITFLHCSLRNVKQWCTVHVFHIIVIIHQFFWVLYMYKWYQSCGLSMHLHGTKNCIFKTDIINGRIIIMCIIPFNSLGSKCLPNFYSLQPFALMPILYNCYSLLLLSSSRAFIS